MSRTTDMRIPIPFLRSSLIILDHPSSLVLQYVLKARYSTTKSGVSLQLHIYFTPADLKAVHASADDIYIIIDLIRATTSITTILERGAARVFVADTLKQ